MIEDDIPRLTHELIANRPEVFELVLSDFLPTLTDFNPNDYFITSGDAVEKTKYMCRELKNLIDKNTNMANEYNDALVKCESLLQLLIVMRNPDLFLETEWMNHRLLCIPKNPRM